MRLEFGQDSAPPMAHPGQPPLRSAPGRVGILTFHRCINYGSYWQARCLVEGLRAMGVDAVLLDHEADAVTRAELRCAFRPTLPLPTPRSDFPAYAAKTRKFLSAFDRLPLSPPFALDRPDLVAGYDTIIVGSDEVWNLHHPWYGGRAIFYGAGLRADLISYAASFGNQDAASGLSPYWADQLRNFRAVSVRDDNSRQMVRIATGIEPEMVLDPCLQFPPIVAAKTERCDDLLLYGHNFPLWFSEAVRRWADVNGRRIVSIGYRNDWADEQWLSAGPEEFAAAMAGAAGVVTNFFHGCVFALVNGRPFVTAPSAYRFNKVRDLMLALGTQHHMATAEADTATYDRLLGTPLDPGIAARIDVLRTRSGRFLRQALALDA